MTDSVRYIDLPKQYQEMREELKECLDRVMSSGSFILRQDVKDFEAHMADLLGVQAVVGVNSGTDALFLSMRALEIGPGDEVITVAHTFVATVATIVHCGATPVFVDIGDDFNMDVSQLEEAVSARTKAIVPVHLNGRTCDMDAVMQVAKRHNLVVIEDAAQALCARYRGQPAGSFGQAGCFSLHPLKLLSVAGDGGFISTQDGGLAETLRMLRDHGQKSKEELVCFGFNSRLDNIHAALAMVKMKHLPQWIDRRRAIADRYHESLHDIPALRLPPPPDGESLNYDVFSSFVVRTESRDQLKQHLGEAKVEVYAHCATPLYHHERLELGHWDLPMTERISQEVLSLPLYPELTDADLQYVIAQVRAFFED